MRCKRLPMWTGVVLICSGSISNAQYTVRISLGPNGEQGNDDSRYAVCSADGRHVVFASQATNLVPGDTNGVQDVFVRDRLYGTVERVNLDSLGDEAIGGGSGGGFDLSISHDGRFVVFTSSATNLVAGDTNDRSDVYVRDRELGTTTRVSVSSSGEQSNGRSLHGKCSPSGRYVVFASEADNLVPGDGNGELDVFLHDRETGSTVLVSATLADVPGDDFSAHASVSEGGRFVSFLSEASDLVTDPLPLGPHAFVRDMQLGTTTLVSKASDGAPEDRYCASGTAISADGRFVAFTSRSSNLVPGDTNGKFDVFTHDQVTGETSIASVRGQGQLSDGDSLWPSISADGRYVGFQSSARNLDDNHGNNRPDAFVRDRLLQTTKRVSTSVEGNPAGGGGLHAFVAPGGQFVAFYTSASDLVEGDTNGFSDCFLHGPKLVLVTDTDRVEVGDSVTFSSWKSLPDSPGLLVLTAVNDIPLQAILEFGFFSPAGGWEFSKQATEGTEGSVYELVTVALDSSGSWTESPSVKVTVESD